MGMGSNIELYGGKIIPRFNRYNLTNMLDKVLGSLEKRREWQGLQTNFKVKGLQWPWTLTINIKTGVTLGGIIRNDKRIQISIKDKWLQWPRPLTLIIKIHITLEPELIETWNL